MTSPVAVLGVCVMAASEVWLFARLAIDAVVLVQPTVLFVSCACAGAIASAALDYVVGV